MDEAKKTNRIRGAAFRERYLSGKVIDIGAGKDLVCPRAERFDVEDGDANHITRYRSPGTYDTVHSSHCLEHMHRPDLALLEWWALVKPGGHLIAVVPDEDLYEQGYWPSRFNADHKATFTLKEGPSWSPVSYNIRHLAASLPGGTLVECELHDQHYDRTLQTRHPPPPVRPVPRSFKLLKKACKLLPGAGRILRERLENRLLRTHHVPVDQTRRRAVAQIQVIVRKG